jgi:anti-sigma B factor antagonist
MYDSKGVSMTIEQEKTAQNAIVLFLSGRLDTANSPLLERKIKQWGEDITELILDFKELSYISSMGLRVLLQAKKTFTEKDRKLVIRNMGDAVREVFEMTGFLNLMVQEEKFIVIRKDEAGVIVLSLNGEMKSENIPVVSKELSGIKEQKTKDPATVILDMEKVTRISTSALKQLKQVIEDTAWKERILRIQNGVPNILVELRKEGMGKLIESR